MRCQKFEWFCPGRLLLFWSVLQHIRQYLKVHYQKFTEFFLEPSLMAFISWCQNVHFSRFSNLFKNRVNNVPIIIAYLPIYLKFFLEQNTLKKCPLGGYFLKNMSKNTYLYVSFMLWNKIVPNIDIFCKQNTGAESSKFLTPHYFSCYS